MKRIISVSCFLFLVFFINTTYASVRFVVIGDTHVPGNAEHSDLINLISNLNPKPDFVINTGDITLDGEQTEWEAWQSQVSPLEIDWDVDPPQYIGAVGNRDTDDVDWQLNWMDFLIGQQRYGDGKSFAFGYDNALFIVLDSQNNTPASWLEDTLSQLADQYEWIFAFWHHPPYPFGAVPMDSSRQDWGPILQSYGAQIIFHGHTHYYVRTFPMYMDGSNHPMRDDEYGIIEIITGGGGADLVDLVPNDQGYGELFAQGKKSYHFCLIDINDKALSMKVIDLNGTIIDSFGVALDDSVDQYPKLEITSPVNGDVVSGTITIEAAATDDHQIVQVDFYFDDEYVGTDSSYPYSYELNSSEVLFGEHTVRAVATDSIGQDTWNSVIVTVAPCPVPVDIKPQFCPNQLNVGSKGILPVAILGTENFDVTQIDPDSIQLTLDENGVSVTPLRWALADVAAPFEPFTGREDCYDCNELGPDGYLDLTLKFDTQEVAGILGSVEDGDCIVLYLMGNLFEEYGGTLFFGEDVVGILKKK